MSPARKLLARCLALAAGLVAANTGIAAAQAAGPAAADRPQPSSLWAATAGYETFWLRGVSRLWPMDASQVKWQGRGPTLTVWRDWHRRRSLRRLEFLASSLGGFAYETGVDSTARPGDGAWWFGGRYEWQHSLFAGHLPKSLTLGGGFQALGERFSFTRHFTPDIVEHQACAYGAAAVTASGRYRLGQAGAVEATWSGGIIGGHSSVSRDNTALASSSEWSPGWMIDVALRGEVRVTARTSIGVKYLHADHFISRARVGAYTTARRQFTLGVVYDR